MRYSRPPGASNPIAALLAKRDYLPQSPEKSRFFMRLDDGDRAVKLRRRPTNRQRGAHPPSNDQHGIPIAVKAVFLVHRLSIGLGR